MKHMRASLLAASRHLLDRRVLAAAGAGVAALATARQQSPQLPEQPLRQTFSPFDWVASSREALCEEAPESCEESPASADHVYEPPPAKLDDPEENAKILTSWRGHIQSARELFQRLDVEGAERELQLALEEAKHFGQSSGPVATSLLNLAQLYRRAGRLADAEPLLVRAADVLEQTAGPNNKVTLLALLDLAATQLDQGKANEANESYKDALERLDTAEANQPHGKQALREVRAGCLFHMARAASTLGDAVQAEARLREALALVEERHGPDSPRVLAPCAELARVLTQQGRRQEGAEYLARARGLPELRESQKKMLDDLAKTLGALKR